MYACLQKQVTYVATLFNTTIYSEVLIQVLIKVLNQVYRKQIIVKIPHLFPLSLKMIGRTTGPLGLTKSRWNIITTVGCLRCCRKRKDIICIKVG